MHKIVRDLFVDRGLFDFGDAHGGESLVLTRFQKQFIGLRWCLTYVDILLIVIFKLINLSSFTFLYFAGSLVVLAGSLLAHCVIDRDRVKKEKRELSIALDGATYI